MNTKQIKCIAFDCFGTVFDMSNVEKEEIKNYVNHVRKNNFTEFEFPQSWWNLKAHPDSAQGIRTLQSAGFSCIALSNGSLALLSSISYKNNIYWNHIVDLVSEKVYKPHVDAYKTIEKCFGFKPEQTLMVTANPTFGDIEGSSAIGMKSQVIRNPETPQTIIGLANTIISNI